MSSERQLDFDDELFEELAEMKQEAPLDPDLYVTFRRTFSFQ